MQIILETNILRSDVQLTSFYFQSLLEYSKRTYSRIIIPEIVFDELASLYRKELEFSMQKVHRAAREVNLFLLHYNIEIQCFDIEKIVEELLENVKINLSVFYLEIIPYKDEYLREVIRRCAFKIKPCSSKGIEFRDTILWLSIVDHIDGMEDSAFISNNTRDFANTEKNDFHQSLRFELNEKKI